VDLANLANIRGTLDGVECTTYTNNSGIETMDNTFTYFNVGYGPVELNETSGSVKNIKVWTE